MLGCRLILASLAAILQLKIGGERSFCDSGQLKPNKSKCYRRTSLVNSLIRRRAGDFKRSKHIQLKLTDPEGKALQPGSARSFSFFCQATTRELKGKADNSSAAASETEEGLRSAEEVAAD
ncbi:uncharacterized protein LOC120322277 [Drosophila yakuba]|uniref:Uncharacterized protein n=1 Tax=Drosophila yakuba TaxID=7245 RepID=A0A0R1EE67_DROYA|nr:uncharacterized protein LOC120322277 [Drosophila yakuba]KRK05745.1 uncharacterized protein Dyak_GE27804 [Drosophila yakuba]